MRAMFAALAMAIVATAAPATATTLTDTVTFTATGFTPLSGDAPAPFDTVSGEFTIADFGEPGIMFNSLTPAGVNISDAGTATYTYLPDFPFFIVGGLNAAFADSVTGGNLQFNIASPDFSPPSPGGGSNGQVTYFDNGVGTFQSTSMTWSNTAALVPEPASWAMMMLGFGGLGAVLRGKRRALSGTAATT